MSDTQQAHGWKTYGVAVLMLLTSAVLFALAALSQPTDVSLASHLLFGGLTLIAGRSAIAKLILAQLESAGWVTDPGDK